MSTYWSTEDVVKGMACGHESFPGPTAIQAEAVEESPLGSVDETATNCPLGTGGVLIEK